MSEELPVIRELPKLQTKPTLRMVRALLTDHDWQRVRIAAIEDNTTNAALVGTAIAAYLKSRDRRRAAGGAPASGAAKGRARARTAPAPGGAP